ncbi:hypothetical protein DL93DRAFT_1588908 [Clavulina sp. PMI_390]|nr:hypothetical protein DL93DRAFT_1588908 [Clavulina sp. PMI_390]
MQCWFLEYLGIQDGPPAKREDEPSTLNELPPDFDEELHTVPPHRAFRLISEKRLALFEPQIVPGAYLFAFSRACISAVFGGGAQNQYSIPHVSRVVHGDVANICYVVEDWNVCAPLRVGEHGVSIRLPENLGVPILDTPNGVTLFRKLAPNKWLYMGQYRFRESEDISGEEWMSLPEKNRRSWYGAAKRFARWNEIICAFWDLGPGEEPSFEQFDEAMAIEATRAGCWTLEFIKYRHDYIQLLSAKEEEKPELRVKREATTEVKAEEGSSGPQRRRSLSRSTRRVSRARVKLRSPS